jgi:hypothetical protein
MAIVWDLAFVPAGPWMVFVIFPIAYATLPAFLLATALGLIVGAWANRARLSARQLLMTLLVVLLLIANGAAMMVVALEWVNEPK